MREKRLQTNLPFLDRKVTTWSVENAYNNYTKTLQYLFNENAEYKFCPVHMFLLKYQAYSGFRYSLMSKVP